MGLRGGQHPKNRPPPLAERAVVSSAPALFKVFPSSQGLDNALSWLSYGSAPVEGSAMVHNTAVSIDAIDVSPVRPVAPPMWALRAHDTPSRDGLQGKGDR